MDKLNLAVIFGGNSPEYNVSLKSAYSIIKHLNHVKYNLILIGITPSGEWFRFVGSIDKIADDTWFNQNECIKVVISPNHKVGLLEFHTDDIQTTKIDIAMPILHGRNGEDGTIQGLLELADISIVGCKTLCSALCMDKELSHTIVNSIGINTAPSIVIKNKTDINDILNQIDGLVYPLFVKPVRSGSSFGITCINSPAELKKAIFTAFEYDNKVIIEEKVNGFEVGCAILGNEDLIIGEIDEIELTEGFFDYTEKYTLKTSKIHVPARISNEKVEEVKNIAALIYKTLGCSGFARVDLFLTHNGEILFNEVNTIPGFTEHSRYPNMLKAIGLTFENIIDKLIKLAIKS